MNRVPMDGVSGADAPLMMSGPPGFHTDDHAFRDPLHRGAAEPEPESLDPALLVQLTDFMFELRVAGVAVTIERIMRFLWEAEYLADRTRESLRVTGRALLCESAADRAAFDRCYDSFFPVRSSRPDRARLTGDATVDELFTGRRPARRA